MSRSVAFDKKAVYRYSTHLNDGLLTTNALGTVTILDSTGVDPGWLTNGPVISDGSGLGLAMVGVTCQFRLQDFNNYGSIQNFWEQFRLDGVQVTITTSMGDSYGSSGGVASALPTVYSVIDQNDGSILPDEQTARAYSTCIERQISQDNPFTRTFKPAVAMQLYGPFGTNPFGFAEPGVSPWVDTKSAGVYHYANKLFIKNFPGVPATGFGLRFSAKAFFSLRLNS